MSGSGANKNLSIKVGSSDDEGIGQSENVKIENCANHRGIKKEQNMNDDGYYHPNNANMHSMKYSLKRRHREHNYFDGEPVQYIKRQRIEMAVDAQKDVSVFFEHID